MDIEEVVKKVENALVAVDQWVADHPDVPKSSRLSVVHARGNANHLLATLQLVPGAIAAAAPPPVAEPVYGDFEVMMTAKLKAAGQLPEDATPRDFLALQARRVAEGTPS